MSQEKDSGDVTGWQLLPPGWTKLLGQGGSPETVVPQNSLQEEPQGNLNSARWLTLQGQCCPSSDEWLWPGGQSRGTVRRQTTSTWCGCLRVVLPPSPAPPGPSAHHWRVVGHIPGKLFPVWGGRVQ